VFFDIVEVMETAEDWYTNLCLACGCKLLYVGVVMDRRLYMLGRTAEVSAFPDYESSLKDRDGKKKFKW
jgi:hypothetical protein